MSLLGIVRHLTDVERHWFREVVAREDVRFLYWGNPDRDSDFDDLRAEDAERDFLAFLEELEHSRAIQRTAELEAAVGRPGGRRATLLPVGDGPHDRGVRQAQRSRRPVPSGHRRRDR